MFRQSFILIDQFADLPGRRKISIFFYVICDKDYFFQTAHSGCAQDMSGHCFGDRFIFDLKPRTEPGGGDHAMQKYRILPEKN